MKNFINKFLTKILQIGRKLISFEKYKNIWQKWVIDILSFTILLLVHLTAIGFKKLSSFHLFPSFITRFFSPSFSRFYTFVRTKSRRSKSTISRLNLIDLALKNMMAKRSRTFITIGGMSIGIAAVVFLVSLGYGIQNLVIKRVARLEEMRQTEVTTQPGTNIRITDASISKFQNIPNVEHVLPLIAVVGRVNYQNSVTDTAVYGVTTEYLKQSAIKPVAGRLIESDQISLPMPVSQKNEDENKGTVAGYSIALEPAAYGNVVREIKFSINPGIWVRIRKNPSPDSPILGYTRRVEGYQSGKLFWGKEYVGDNGSVGIAEDGTRLGKWIKSKYYIWNKKTCNLNKEDCESGIYVKTKDSDNAQVQTEGYVAQIGITILNEPKIIQIPKVLGESTSATESTSLLVDTTNDATSFITADQLAISATNSADLELMSIASEAGILEKPKTKTVKLANSAIKEAVVNRAFLKVLGLEESKAIGEKFDVKFVVTGDLLNNEENKLESNVENYNIVGIIPTEDTPYFYVPFIDLRGLGIANYSQIKLVVKSTKILDSTRKNIESMGYTTTSVVDTVQQIDQLFTTIRTILAALGTVALSVAALGMFNTLTISLLERTREVGLMKAMGMKSHEVKDLFLTESMIMGLIGGILGVLLGFLAGKGLGLFLSIFAIAKGAGYIDISYIPPLFLVVTLLLSLTVGIFTGIYPARRATKISALNALRYE